MTETKKLIKPKKQQKTLKKRFRLFSRAQKLPNRTPAALGGTGSSIEVKRFFDTRLFVMVLLLITGFLFVSVTREAVRRVQIGREIRTVKQEIAKQEARNAQMAVLTKVLNTSTAQEKQSRLTLNSIIPGETVVIIESDNTASAQDSESEVLLPNGETVDTISGRTTQTSNPKKWFDYFFSNI